VCSEASAVMGAVVANFFPNSWNLKVSPDKGVRHIPWCVYYHVQGLRLEAFQDLDVGCGNGDEFVIRAGRPPFTPQEDSWYSFLLVAESTPGP
jgi:hypothetical protein